MCLGELTMKINQSLLEFVSASPETKGLTVAEVEEALRSFEKDVVLFRNTLQQAPYLITGAHEVEVSFGVDLSVSGVRPLFKVAAALLADGGNTDTFLCVSVVNYYIRFHWPSKNRKELCYEFGVGFEASFELDDDDQYTAWDLYGEGSRVAPREEVVADN